MRRLLIRPGAIGDFIVSLPALEALQADYTEVWCAGQNVPLARFADRAQSIVSAGLDRLGLLDADDVVARLREFDSIVSWYGTGRPEFRELCAALKLPIRFFPALPDGSCHAVEFYLRQTGETRPGFPVIDAPSRQRTFAVMHPFASSMAKRAPLARFQSIARRLADEMPVHWLAGPEEEVEGAVRIADLYELACWLRACRLFVGNDSGIAHLAAATGAPVLVFFRASDPRVWSPRGPAVQIVSTEGVLRCDSRAEEQRTPACSG